MRSFLWRSVLLYNSASMLARINPWVKNLRYPFQGLTALVLVLILSILILGKLEVWAVLLGTLVGLMASLDAGSLKMPSGRPALSVRFMLRLPSHVDRGSLNLLGLAALMAFGALLITGSRDNNANYLDAALLWAGSMATVVYGAVRQDRSAYRLGLARWELVFVGVLLACSLVIRLVAIDQLPRNFGGDEGSMALPGRWILQGKAVNPFGTGWYSVPNLFSYVQAAFMALLGDTVLGARAQSALVGALAVVATYFLGRRVLGRGWAGVAAFLLAVNHMHLFFSRLSSNMIEDTLLAPVGILLLLVGLSTGRWLFFVATGIVLGLSQYFYFGGRLLPFVALGIVAFSALSTRGKVLREMWPQLGVMVLSFLVTFAPLLGYYLQHPADYFSRINQVSIFQSGWLAREVASTGRSPWEVVLGQILRTLLVFVNGGPGGWYHIGQPLMDTFNAFLLFTGIFSSFGKVRRIEHFSVLLTFFAVVVGVGLTEGLPASQRMVLILPFAALLQAAGLGTVARLLEGAGMTRLASPAVALGFLTAGYLNVSTFLNVSLVYEYGYTNTTVATELAYYLRSRADNPTVFFYGAPRMWYGGFSTLPFIAPNAKGIDVDKGGTAFPKALAVPPPRLFVFLPERRGEMAEVLAVLSGGTTIEFRRSPGETLFTVYEADASRQ